MYFDAYPITEGKLLLAFESITPHDKTGLKNPNPIRLLKVPPEVEFLFRFQLHDGKQLLKDEKRKLFKELLLLTGIGAKTNVGFGGLAESKTPGPYRMLEMRGAGQRKNQTLPNTLKVQRSQKGNASEGTIIGDLLSKLREEIS